MPSSVPLPTESPDKAPPVSVRQPPRQPPCRLYLGKCSCAWGRPDWRPLLSPRAARNWPSHLQSPAQVLVPAGASDQVAEMDSFSFECVLLGRASGAVPCHGVFLCCVYGWVLARAAAQFPWLCLWPEVPSSPRQGGFWTDLATSTAVLAVFSQL